MLEWPGPQLNRGSDPTTAVGKVRNATQKKWYLRFWKQCFLVILCWRAESPIVFSGRPPLVLDQKEAPRAEKFFMRPGPPRYLRVWMTAPPLLSEGLDPPLAFLGKKEKWRLCLNRVKPLFEVVAACSPNVRTYLSWSLNWMYHFGRSFGV